MRDMYWRTICQSLNNNMIVMLANRADAYGISVEPQGWPGDQVNVYFVFFSNAFPHETQSRPKYQTLIIEVEQ